LRKGELDRLKAEEALTSDTDLSEIRKKWRKTEHLEPLPGSNFNERPIRNHGLFSKAERALEIAGWSETARDDVEIFRLVDAEGLTPLLMVLNEAPSSGGSETLTPARPTAAS
jgi:hypothetical protein